MPAPCPHCGETWSVDATGYCSNCGRMARTGETMTVPVPVSQKQAGMFYVERPFQG